LHLRQSFFEEAPLTVVQKETLKKAFCICCIFSIGLFCMSVFSISDRLPTLQLTVNRVCTFVFELDTKLSSAGTRRQLSFESNNLTYTKVILQNTNSCVLFMSCNLHGLHVGTDSNNTNIQNHYHSCEKNDTNISAFILPHINYKAFTLL